MFSKVAKFLSYRTNREIEKMGNRIAERMFASLGSFFAWKKLILTYTPDSIAHAKAYPHIYDLYEKFRKFNRATSTLFTDAATVFFFNKKFKVIKFNSYFKKNSYQDLCATNKSNLSMNGSSVFNFVTSDVIPGLKEFLKNSSWLRRKVKFKIFF